MSEEEELARNQRLNSVLVMAEWGLSLIDRGCVPLVLCGYKVEKDDTITPVVFFTDDCLSELPPMLRLAIDTVERRMREVQPQQGEPT